MVTGGTRIQVIAGFRPPEIRPVSGPGTLGPMATGTPRIDALVEARSRVSHRVPSDVSPAPRTGIAIVTCMDARLDPYREFDLEVGDAHVIRTAGATVTEDVLRSLAASQWGLGTREILLVGHTGCGMSILDEDEIRRRIHEGGSGLPPFPMLTFGDVTENVREGIAAIRGAWFLHPETAVLGLVYDLTTGMLEPVEA